MVSGQTESNQKATTEVDFGRRQGGMVLAVTHRWNAVNIDMLFHFLGYDLRGAWTNTNRHSTRGNTFGRQEGLSVGPRQTLGPLSSPSASLWVPLDNTRPATQRPYPSSMRPPQR